VEGTSLIMAFSMRWRSEGLCGDKSKSKTYITYITKFLIKQRSKEV
jgi:hypothetical protein